MQLTVNSNETKTLRTWLRIGLASAMVGPSMEAVMSNNDHDPEVYRKFEREKLICQKEAVIIRDLLKRLKTK